MVAASRALAQQMVARMLRTELDRLLLQAINNNPLQRNGMRNTQLGRLRVVVQRALAGSHENAVPATQRLLAFLENLKESARNQLQRARVGNTPLLGWLKDLAQTPEAVWTILGATALTPPTLGDVRAQLTPELAVEYALRLIDGIAQLATREETND